MGKGVSSREKLKTTLIYELTYRYPQCPGHLDQGAELRVNLCVLQLAGVSAVDARSGGEVVLVHALRQAQLANALA